MVLTNTFIVTTLGIQFYISKAVGDAGSAERFLTYQLLLNTDNQLNPFNPFMNNDLFDCYLVGKFLDNKTELVIYDRKG